MQYIRIKLIPNNGDPEFECYQEVTDYGVLVSHRDLSGNTITPGECSGYVIDALPPTPEWAVVAPVEPPVEEPPGENP